MTKQPKLLTLRQFLFLHWLYLRKVKQRQCNLSHTDIKCAQCLRLNKECKEGVIPASFFYKKIHRQYYDCKRVLNSLVSLNYIKRKELDGIDYSVFYEITQNGIDFYHKFRKYYDL